MKACTLYSGDECKELDEGTGRKRRGTKETFQNRQCFIYLIPIVLLDGYWLKKILSSTCATRSCK